MAFSFEARLLRAADGLARKLGLFECPLRAEELIRLAQERTGLTDFGDSSFEEPIEILLRDYHQTADLSLFGRMAARWDVLRLLCNLLQLREQERSRPEILKQSIDGPVFITGLPRSGSSFLHDLLARDSNTLVPLCWETICPCPPIDEAGRRLRREAKKADRMIANFNRLTPELRATHPMSGFSAQECTELTAHIFRSQRFRTTHRLAEYASWLDHADDMPAYRFHKRFLQHLQYRKGPGRWIVKCPEHIFSLESIRAVYPDASFVFMHRDPFEMLQSVAKLTEVLREPFTRHIDRPQIGEEVSDFWSRGANLLVDADMRLRDAACPVFNVRYRQLVKNPLATVRELYEHFGLPLGEETLDRFARFIAAQRNAGRGRARYRPEEFGLARERVARRFADYVAHFDIVGGADVDAAVSAKCARPSLAVATE